MGLALSAVGGVAGLLACSCCAAHPRCSRSVSGFDYTGRVVKGPAPRNLSIPPHRYAGPTRLIIGEPTQST